MLAFIFSMLARAIADVNGSSLPVNVFVHKDFTSRMIPSMESKTRNYLSFSLSRRQRDAAVRAVSNHATHSGDYRERGGRLTAPLEKQDSVTRAYRGMEKAFNDTKEIRGQASRKSPMTKATLRSTLPLCNVTSLLGVLLVLFFVAADCSL